MLRIILLILMIFNLNCIQLSSIMVQIGSNAIYKSPFLSVLAHSESQQNVDIKRIHID